MQCSDHCYLTYSCQCLKSSIVVGYISEKTNEQSYRNSCCGDCAIDNAFISEDEIIDKFMIFVQGCLKSHLLKMAALLSEVNIIVFRASTQVIGMSSIARQLIHRLFTF